MFVCVPSDWLDRLHWGSVFHDQSMTTDPRK